MNITDRAEIFRKRLQTENLIKHIQDSIHDRLDGEHHSMFIPSASDYTFEYTPVFPEPPLSITTLNTNNDGMYVNLNGVPRQVSSISTSDYTYYNSDTRINSKL